MDLTQSTSKWLVLGMLRSSEIMDMVAQRLTMDDFRDNEPLLRVAFLIGKRWHDSDRSSSVPREVAISTFADEIVRNRVLADGAALEFGEMLHWAYDTRPDHDMSQLKTYVLNILQQFLIDRKVRTAAAGLDRQADIVDKLDELTKVVSRSILSRADFIDPFSSETPLLCSTKRIPWGVDWMDLVTSGGATPGETTLVLAPSGGGKTLTNVQMATTAALNGEETMIITYEQSATPGITNRIYACAMGMPIPTFMGMSGQDFQANRIVREKYEKVRKKLSGKLTIVDQMKAAQTMAGGGSGGAREIETIIKQAQDDGKNPRYIGVDWFGPMVNNYMAVNGVNSSEITKVMNSQMDELRKVGDRLGVNIFVYHQLGTQASQAGARKKPEATDAYQCRTLHHYMDTVVCIGNRDRESNLAWINAPKVRNGEPFSDMLIQMEGAMSRWKLVDKSEVNTESMKFYGGSSADEEAPKARDPFAFNSAVRAHLG